MASRKLAAPHNGRSDNFSFFLSRSFLIIWFALINVVNITGLFTRWYLTVPWLDSVLHFAGGFWVGLVFFALVREYVPELEDGRHALLVLSVFLISGAALVGVFWEFFEFILDHTINFWNHAPLAQASAADTMSDLFFDLVGGVGALLFRLILG